MVFVRHALPGERVLLTAHRHQPRPVLAGGRHRGAGRLARPRRAAVPGRRPRAVRRLRLAAREPARAAPAQDRRRRRAAAAAGRPGLGRARSRPSRWTGSRRRRARLAHPDALPRRRRRPGRAAQAPLERAGPGARGRLPDRLAPDARGGRTARWPADAELRRRRVAHRVGAPRRRPGRRDVRRRRTPDGGLREPVAGRTYAVAADGFWQVHPAAAATLVGAVLEGLAPQPGERAFDLYCGVGLFAGALVDAGCQVWGLESGRAAVAAARRNLADAGRPRQVHAPTASSGASPGCPTDVDLVVLDPPRSGAGAQVMRGDRRPPTAGDRLRRLRPGRPGPRPGHRGEARLRADQHPRLRPVPDDPARRVRGAPAPGQRSGSGRVVAVGSAPILVPGTVRRPLPGSPERR